MILLLGAAGGWFFFARVAVYETSESARLEVARSALENLRQFRTSVHGLRGISRDLNRASQRLVNASDGLLSFMERVEAFAVRAIDLLKERLEVKGA